MATTLVQVRNPKRVVYVGGLDDGVTEAALHAAFLPFGDIRDVSMPLDNATGRHRGFGFVEFEEADDASEACRNMDAGEFFGRTLRVNLAQGGVIASSGGPSGGGKNQPVWADADRYLDELEREQQLERADEEARAAAAERRRAEETAAAERAEKERAGGGGDAMEALEKEGGG